MKKTVSILLLLILIATLCTALFACDSSNDSGSYNLPTGYLAAEEKMIQAGYLIDDGDCGLADERDKEEFPGLKEYFSTYEDVSKSGKDEDDADWIYGLLFDSAKNAKAFLEEKEEDDFEGYKFIQLDAWIVMGTPAAIAIFKA